MPDEFALGLLSIRQLDIQNLEFDHPPAVNLLGVEDFFVQSDASLSRKQTGAGISRPRGEPG
jgi:hypothetical protein